MLRIICLSCFLVLSLSSCSNSAKQALGLDRKAPDEFTVISRAPLSVPPVFDMRPPKLGEVRPQEGTPVDTAKQSLFAGEKQDNEEPFSFSGIRNKSIVSVSEISEGESVFLSKAKTKEAMSDIRKIIDQENSSIVEENAKFVDKLVFWKEPEDPTEVLVDPNEENKRIQENQALGKPVNDGIIPTIEKRRKGIFER